MTELITPDGKPTEAGRAMIEMWRMGVKEWERLQGHTPKLPKVPSDGGKRSSGPTVPEMIARALATGPKTRAQICRKTGKKKGHISAELTRMTRAGLVKKDTITDGGIKLPAWSLT